MAWGKVIEQTDDRLVLDIDDIDPITFLRMRVAAKAAGRCAEHNDSRTAGIRQMKDAMRKKGQKVPRHLPSKLLSVLDSYELPAYKALADSLNALGKPPDRKQVSLNAILARIAAESEAEKDDGKADDV